VTPGRVPLRPVMGRIDRVVNNWCMTTTDSRPARSPGITYQELLDTDTHPVPDVLRLESPRFLGDADISRER
jgi:hypothetical protein